MNPFSPDSLFNIPDDDFFLQKAMEVFRYQSVSNQVYREFIRLIGVNPRHVSKICEIPFLPVELFKTHKIISGKGPVKMIFESSGTTGTQVSRHYILDTSLYEESFNRTFRLFYGEPADYMIAALLPSYEERENSSLVFMTDNLIRTSDYKLSGFYRDITGKLIDNILAGKRDNKKILLFGVSFALLDLAGKYSPDFSDIIVMETGGMKGRRKEVIREELHAILTEQFRVDVIHSEYGMTELLSQAYSRGGGRFFCPPWMKVLIRNTYDPFEVTDENERTGGINIIDLANINSCSFIATGDLGKNHQDGSFEVLGRFDKSDIRGCNLLFE